MGAEMPENFLSQEEVDALLQGGRGSFAPVAEGEGEGAEGEIVPNLSLILDFPLNLSVRLGDTKKCLKDILQLTPGYVIELENYVNNPVYIYVNGNLIARGEVIAIDENFGVKISHILDPIERVRQLGDRK